MADTSYEVDIILNTKGQFPSFQPEFVRVHDTIGKAGASLSGLSDGMHSFAFGVQDIGRKVSSVFEQVGDRIIDLGAKLGKIGTAVAFGAVAYSVSQLNDQLERTQISLAAIFNANGVVSTMGEGMSKAEGMMGRMRKDAAQLPGEFNDLVNIFSSIAVPGFMAGLSPEKLQSMSSQFMAIGAVMKIPEHVVAREAAMLMEGRSGAHNVLGLKLGGLAGNKATTFNAMSIGDRAVALQGMMAKYADSIDVYKNSYEGLSSTFRDNVKLLMGTATAPLFDSMKTSLAAANKWFDEHSKEMTDWAVDFGVKLGHAWEWGTQKIVSWWPAIYGAAESVEKRIVSIFHKVEPLISKIGNAIKTHFGDVSLFDKLESLVKIGLMIKAGSVIFDVGKSLFNLTSGVGALGTGALGSLMGGAGAAGLAGGVATPVGAAVGGALTVGAAVAATGALLGMAGAIHSVTDSSSLFHVTATSMFANLKQVTESNMSLLHKEWDRVEPKLMRAADFFGTVMLAQVDGMMSFANVWLQAIDWVTTFQDRLLGMISNAELNRDDPLKYTPDPVPIMHGHYMDENSIGRKTPPDNKTHNPPAGQNMNIQKVEIVVTANDDPNRVARIIESHLSGIAKRPRSSRDVRNFASSRSY